MLISASHPLHRHASHETATFLLLPDCSALHSMFRRTEQRSVCLSSRCILRSEFVDTFVLAAYYKRAQSTAFTNSFWHEQFLARTKATSIDGLRAREPLLMSQLYDILLVICVPQGHDGMYNTLLLQHFSNMPSVIHKTFFHAVRASSCSHNRNTHLLRSIASASPTI